MDKKEAAKLLAIIKCAYPSQYKNMQDSDAKITISLWQSHFANIPAELVYQAVNRHIAKSSYAPAISEINDELHIIHLNALETITGMFTDATASEIERAERIDRLLSGYEQNQRRLPE